MTKRTKITLAVVVLGLVALGVFSATRWFAPKPKNVIIILVDTLRADHLGMYGYDRDTSPRLDAFAGRATLYKDAVSAAPWTPPSVASVLTGMYPTAHGFMPPRGRNNARRESTKFASELYTLPELLRDEGYATIGITSNPWISEEFGFAQGFDEFLHMARSAYADDITDEGIRALTEAEASGSPVFLYLHYLDPHSPYEPKEGYDEKFDGPSSTGDYPPKQLRRVNLYDGEIAFNDREIGRFLDHLEEQGLYDDSIIIFVADHGEQFHEHGEWGHGNSVYDPEVHVPLIVKSDSAPATVDTTVSTVDIYPTVLDLLGLEIPAHVQGVSLNDQKALEARRGILTEISRVGDFRGYVDRRGVKLILKNPPRVGISEDEAPPTEVVGVFDRRADPRERKPIADSDVVKTLMYDERQAYTKVLEQRVNPEQMTMTEEQVEHLKSLGYLN